MTNNYNSLLSKKNVREILEFYKRLRQENREKKQKIKQP